MLFYIYEEFYSTTNMTIAKLFVADTDPGSVAFLIPISRIRIRDAKKSGIQDEHPVSYSWVKNYINSLLRIRIRDLVISGSGMEKLKSDPGSWILYP
jgi:hypothetical protein